MHSSRVWRSIGTHAWALACLGAIAAVYFPWTATDQMGSVTNDGPGYLMMARHYSPHLRESPVNAEYAAYARFPPLYPLLLAATGAAAAPRSVHRVTTACLLAGLAAYYGWLLAAGLLPSQAALLTLLTALLPGSWLQALSVQSEFLYLFFSLVALSLLTLCERPALAARRDELLYAAALAVAAAALTRAAGVALLLPLLLAAWRAPRRAGLFALMAAVLPLLARFLLHHSHLGYGQALGDIYGVHPGRALAALLGKDLAALRGGLAADLLHAPLRAGWLADLLGLLLLAAAAVRLLRLRHDGLYVAAYLAIVALWPYPEEAWRFVWVILPVAFGQCVLAVADWRRVPPAAGAPRLATLALGAAVLTLAAPSAVYAAQRFRAAEDSALPAARGLAAWYDLDPARAMHLVHFQLELLTALRRVGEQTPPAACVIALRPDLVNFYADRRAFLPPLDSVPDPAFQDLLRAPGCGYVFMSDMTYSMFPLALHPLQRLPQPLQVLDYTDEADPPPGQGTVTTVLALLDAAPAPAERR